MVRIVMARSLGWNEMGERRMGTGMTDPHYLKFKLGYPTKRVPTYAHPPPKPQTTHNHPHTTQNKNAEQAEAQWKLEVNEQGGS